MLQITLFVHIIIRIAEGNFSSLTDRFIDTIDNIIPALVFPLHTTLDLDILSQIQTILHIASAAIFSISAALLRAVINFAATASISSFSSANSNSLPS